MTLRHAASIRDEIGRIARDDRLLLTEASKRIEPLAVELAERLGGKPLREKLADALEKIDELEGRWDNRHAESRAFAARVVAALRALGVSPTALGVGDVLIEAEERAGNPTEIARAEAGIRAGCFR